MKTAYNIDYMKRKYSITILFTLIILLLTKNGYTQVKYDTLVDLRDGKKYKTVEIGNQVWMAENLNYGKFISTKQEYLEEENKYCYNNEESNCGLYGGLYNWQQVSSQSLCPEGWHVPSKKEWEALSSFLGEKIAGKKSKASPNDVIPWDGTNESGLSIIPSGCGNGEEFHRLKQWATFWTSDESDNLRAWFIRFDGFWYENPPKYNNIIIDPYYLKSSALSVRCIRNH